MYKSTLAKQQKSEDRVNDLSQIALYVMLGVQFFTQTLFYGQINKAGAYLFILFLLTISMAYSRSRMQVGSNSRWLFVFIIYILINRNLDLKEGTGLEWLVLFPLTLICCIFFNSLEKDKWIEEAMRIIVAYCVFHALITIAAWISPSFYSTIVKRFLHGTLTATDYKSGFTTHYSTNGIYLAFGMITSFCIYYRKKEKLYLYLSLICLFSLLLTTKRAQLVFGLASVLFVYYLDNRSIGINRAGKIILIIAAAAALYLLIAYLVPDIAEVSNRILMVRDDDTFGHREKFYSVCRSMWNDNLIFGNGWGSFSRAFNQTVYASRYILNGKTAMNAHNVYYQMLAETGIVGVALLFVPMIGSLVSNLRTVQMLDSIRKNASSNEEARRLLSQEYWCISMLCFFLLYCVTGNPLYDIQTYVSLLMAQVGSEYIRKRVIELT